MNDIALVLEHSVEADVSLAFAWRFRTDVANWSDPPATFTLDGPFVEDSRGTTLLPGQGPLRWRIANVQPEYSFEVEMPLDRAMLRFQWRFDALTEHRTKLTQRIVLSGGNADAYAQQVQTAFGLNLLEGMDKIASDMVAAGRLAREAD
jgi:hypothetical protein